MGVQVPKRPRHVDGWPSLELFTRLFRLPACCWLYTLQVTLGSCPTLMTSRSFEDVTSKWILSIYIIVIIIIYMHICIYIYSLPSDSTYIYNIDCISLYLFGCACAPCRSMRLLSSGSSGLWSRVSSLTPLSCPRHPINSSSPSA